MPETVYCPGKTAAQVADIAAAMLAAGQDLLATRATREQYEAAARAVQQRDPRVGAELNRDAPQLNLFGPLPLLLGLAVTLSQFAVAGLWTFAQELGTTAGLSAEATASFLGLSQLVGLLGTIIGLIKGFTAVAAVNPAEKAAMLSGSISIAMNNTAFALMVAIPFLLIHAFLQARASEIVDSLEAAKITFLNLVQRLSGEQLSAPERRAP